jgi:cytochrome b involved in lipid metabolism
MKNRHILLIGAFVVLGAGCVANPQTAPIAPAGQQDTPRGTSADEVAPAIMDTTDLPGDVVYTLDEVARHATANDCWLAIHNKVYDVTTFTPRHPGRDVILEGCGKDVTTLFETRPMGSGTPHSNKANGMLETYEIGTLAE